MRAFNFSPLYRSSIGFDRAVDLLENASKVTTIDNWPSYDIVKIGEDTYRITMAVAGFSQDELSVTQHQNMLLVTSEKASEDNAQYLHRGIAGGSFQRRFHLADHVRVTGAAMENGLLTINLERDIPEEMKPRRIEIGQATDRPNVPQIEARKQAA